jgi:GTP-binding protein HflX
MDRGSFLAAPLARSLTELSSATGRRIGLLIDRQGNVDKVVIGDPQRVFLPDLGARRAGSKRFRGLRLVLTQLHPEGLSEDELTDLALLQLDAVILVRAGSDGLPGPVEYAHLLPPKEDGDAMWRVEKRKSVHGWTDDFQAFITDLEGQFARSPKLKKTGGRAGVILVGLTLNDPRRAQRGLKELARLADTAGLRVVDSALQNRRKMDGRTYVGTGKLQELLVRSMHLGAEALIFDRELSPGQLRNIAQRTDLKVLDRTQLILDIFASHASTKEGRLQVELAQLRYRMPRLAIMSTAMSRLTGGIGGRGPGETKLEINKRRAQERLTRLEKQLKKLAKGRDTRRQRRRRSGLPVVSIVGYTNAGKSTLLNRVTRSDVLVRDQLFATLDATTRRFRFPEEREIIVTDTVGFIEELPATLVKAFKSTLEELDEANLLLHLVDASDLEVEAHMQAVTRILADLGLEETPVLLVWNKADAADPELLRERLDTHGGMAISALTGAGTEDMLSRIERALFRGQLDQLRRTKAQSRASG